MIDIQQTANSKKAHRVNDGQSQNTGRIKPTSPLKVKRHDGSELTLKGRNAQVMRVLIARRLHGATGLDFSRATTAFRYANILCELRKIGFAIETTHEDAGDCTIGRYWLREPLTIIDGGE